LVLRELEAASAPVRLEPGTSLLWDRRFAVDLAATAASGFTLGYLGRGTVPEIAENGAGDLPRLIYSTLPALWDEQGLAAVPHLGYRRAGVGALPRVLFRAGKPLTHAGFTVV
jgi:tRNA(Ile)-lysidine synthase